MAEWFQAFVIIVTAVGSAAVALLISSFTRRYTDQKRRTGTRSGLEPVVFLFEDQHLIDATDPARALLETAPEGRTDWLRLMAYLAPRFEGFAGRLDALAPAERMEMTAADGTDDLRLCAEDVGGVLRITLVDRNAEGRGALVDGLSLRALEDEVDHARHLFDKMPIMVWRENSAGKVTWANRAYFLRCEAFGSDGLGVIWPLPRLFAAGSKEGGPHRVPLVDKDGNQAWFECFSTSVGADHLHYALPADEVVRAERSLRDFVQTLSKTFADLPIGLAVFDRKRQLQLFNPALTELTMLQAQFLLGHPTLYAFLDRLRETQMMPEPKDYSSWRQHMADLEKAAASGFHSETWTLPRGQTYRVTGRPHPGGAVAFLFEDISSEMAVTRRFRAELALGQAVLDRMPQAVAVFDGAGDLVMSNASYDQLWNVEPETSLGRMTWADSIAIWHDVAGPQSLWAQASNCLHAKSGNPSVHGEVALPDGRSLMCEFSPIPGGTMLATFTVLQPVRHQALATAD